MLLAAAAAAVVAQQLAQVCLFINGRQLYLFPSQFDLLITFIN